MMEMGPETQCQLGGTLLSVSDWDVYSPNKESVLESRTSEEEGCV